MYRLLPLLILLLLPRPVSAGGFSNLDFGIRRMGMFAVVARPDDGTAVYHNPAGLLLQDGTHLYHHQSWIFGDTRFRFYDSQGKLHPDHEVGPDWNIGFSPFLGLTSDLGTERLRAGLAIYAPNAYGAILPEDEPTRYHATRAIFVAARATGSLAWAVSRRFWVGASVNLVYVHLDAQRYMNPMVLQDPDNRFLPREELEDLDARMDLDGRDLSWAVDVGLLFTPLDTLRIGLLFAGGSPIDLAGDIKLTYADDSVETSRHRTEMTIPFTLRGGINWEFAPDFELGFDAVFWHYQVFQEQRSELTSPIMGQEELVDPKNYENGFLWCVGMLYHVAPRWELMLGYQEDYTPIPERAFTLDNPIRDTRAVSMGVRWQASRKVRIGAAMIRLWNELVDVQTSLSVPPANAKGYGSMTFFGADVDWRL